MLTFYTKLIGQTTSRRSHVDINILRNGAQLNREHQDSLTNNVNEKEIWQVVKSIRDKKSPGVDGYNAKSFKTSWWLIKVYVIKAVQYFFVNNRLHKAVNCAVVTLIPKTKDAKTMKEMRPIACCTTLYKIILKVFTTRLSRFMNHVMDDSQTAFLLGKTIQDNIVLAYEILRGYNRKHLFPRRTLQIDLQKAYDTVEWDALGKIMNEMSFPAQFTNWIMIAVRSISYRYMING